MTFFARQVNGLSVPFFSNSTVQQQVLAVANLTNVAHGVVSDDACRTSPCENGGVCNVTWNDYESVPFFRFLSPKSFFIFGTLVNFTVFLVGFFSCLCPAAFRGKNCSDHKPCSIYRCPDGGKCVDLKNGYECTYRKLSSSVLFHPAPIGHPTFIVFHSGRLENCLQCL